MKIYAGGHLFDDLFLQGRGGIAPSPPGSATVRLHAQFSGTPHKFQQNEHTPVQQFYTPPEFTHPPLTDIGMS